LEQLLGKSNVTEQRLDLTEKQIQAKADINLATQFEQRIKKIEETLGRDHIKKTKRNKKKLIRASKVLLSMGLRNQ